MELYRIRYREGSSNEFFNPFDFWNSHFYGFGIVMELP